MRIALRLAIIVLGTTLILLVGSLLWLLWRLWLLGLGFLTLFTIIGAKIVHLAVLAEGREPVPTITTKLDTGAQEFRRSQLTDRNGRLLSDNVYRKAAYAVPAKIVDLDGTIDGLAQIFPELNVGRLRADLNSNKSFVYIKRRLTPDQEAAVFNLGEPGLNFLEEQYRVYPHGNLTSHIVGFNDIDTFGQARVEAARALHEECVRKVCAHARMPCTSRHLHCQNKNWQNFKTPS